MNPYCECMDRRRSDCKSGPDCPALSKPLHREVWSSYRPEFALARIALGLLIAISMAVAVRRCWG